MLTLARDWWLVALRGFAAVVLVSIGSAIWASWCRRRLGGITGDTLGAMIVAAECLVFLLFTGSR